MSNSALENLPEISLLDEEGITVEAIQNEMISDYQEEYEKRTGKKVTVQPTDERHTELTVVAGVLYQLCAIMDERYKMNFLPYMYGDALKNWASNFGFTESGERSATTTIRFGTQPQKDYAVGIPKGTRVTSGDNVFFETDEYTEIAPGADYADVTATCTTAGISGNGYQKGQISTIVDPVNNIDTVENISVSDGGRDEYTDDERRELILNFPSTYSTAGPEDAYIRMVAGYSDHIVSVRKVSAGDAIVRMCIMCAEGEVPDESYCDQVKNYVRALKNTPDTDKVEIIAPEVVEYDLRATYYISESRKDIAESIKDGVEEAAEAFKQYTQENIGYDINTDIFVAYANAAGARRIEIESPGYQTIKENQIAICRSANIKYGGLEEE